MPQFVNKFQNPHFGPALENFVKIFLPKLINHHLPKARVFKKTLFHLITSLERNNFMQKIKKIIWVMKQENF